MAFYVYFLLRIVSWDFMLPADLTFISVPSGGVGNYLFVIFINIAYRKGGFPAGWLPSRTHTPWAYSTHLFLRFPASESWSEAAVLQRVCTAVSDSVCQHPRKHHPPLPRSRALWLSCSLSHALILFIFFALSHLFLSLFLRLFLSLFLPPGFQ